MPCQGNSIDKQVLSIIGLRCVWLFSVQTSAFRSYAHGKWGGLGANQCTTERADDHRAVVCTSLYLQAHFQRVDYVMFFIIGALGACR